MLVLALKFSRGECNDKSLLREGGLVSNKCSPSSLRDCSLKTKEKIMSTTDHL